MDKSSPFKFLDSFEKEDYEAFFGREREIKTLFRRTFESNMLLLYGLSGTGKTSLVRCGLSNMFADTDWLPLFIRRGRDIIERVEQHIYDAALEKEPLTGQAIHRQLHSLYLDHYKPIYLIFDQFEELFVLGTPEEADRFFWLLAELLRTNLQVKVILIMREEYLAHLDRFERIVPILFDNRYRVEGMRKENLQQVVLQSARQFGITIPEPQDAVCRTIIDHIRNKRGGVELANLQVYLDRLYRDDLKRRGSEDRSILFDGSLLQQTGRLEDVLARFLDEQLDAITQELLRQGYRSENLALSVLAQLVSDEATKLPRRSGAIVEQLTTDKGLSEEAIYYCIHRLQEMRIIRYL